MLVVNREEEGMKPQKLVSWEYALTESRYQKQEDLGFEKSLDGLASQRVWIHNSRTAHLPEP